ncbi:hypothetical protein [Mucilaginibacter ginsenosidivorans]|uniref:hypothetical protein n=1 Tax=Mucilaginibacter ginsenosidivorans TaxID=398053 RepID=UPI0016527E27|nr:hypothetical protein [Mucilaginibacter ginsenosidivorans]
MDSLLLKYNSLDPDSKKQVMDYIDTMVARMKKPKRAQSEYKKRILSIPVWSEEDIKPITDRSPFNTFKPEEW